MASERVVIYAIVFAVIVSFANAKSDFFDPMTDYQVQDILTNVSLSGYDVYGDNVVCWADNSLSLKVYAKSGTEQADWGGPAGYSGWNSFVKLDPSGDSAWVGMSVSGNTDDRIYQVDLATGTWTYKATLGGNFDMAFSGGDIFVSALDEELENASIWLLDDSGGNNHDLIATVGGYSAGLALDSAGSIVYASSGLAENALIKFSASQVAAAIGPISLVWADSLKLSDINGGAYDTDIDDAGNIVFSANEDVSSYTAIWNGNSGSGMNYDLFGIGKGTFYNWFKFVDCEGDVTTDGLLYQSDFYFNGLAEIAVIPEPATILILGFGGAVYTRFRGRRLIDS